MPREISNIRSIRACILRRSFAPGAISPPTGFRSATLPNTKNAQARWWTRRDSTISGTKARRVNLMAIPIGHTIIANEAESTGRPLLGLERANVQDRHWGSDDRFSGAGHGRGCG